MRVVAEGAGDEQIEAGIGGLAGGLDQIGPRDGAKLGADEDCRSLFTTGVRRTRSRPIAFFMLSVATW